MALPPKEVYIEYTLKMVQDEIDHILSENVLYSDYRNSVEICDEQIFAKKKDINPDHIYIVVKFGQASFSFGQALMPITINAVSEQNKLDICQKILFALATEYSLEPPINSAGFPDEDYVKQIWNTPNVITNFNEINIGFRSLFYMTGTILIGHNSSPITELIYNKDATDGSTFNLHEYMITFSDSFDVYPDTQAFYTTNGIGKTEAKTASYAFSVTLFKVTSTFMSLCRSIKRGDLTGAPNGISTKFSFSMRDKDETGYWTEQYTLVNMTMQQNKGDLPTVALTFAR